MAGVDEFGLIRLLNEGRQSMAWLRGNGVDVGIGDDAAVVTAAAGMQMTMSCDTMVQDIHFKDETMADADVGFKAMAASISDMAAMGAMPRYALVSLVCPRTVGVERLKRLYAGLYECAGQYGVAVVGGDTTATTGGLVVSVTVIGEVEPGRALLRSAAKPGDAVFVTGALGLSAAGLHALLAGNAAEPACARLIAAHQRPLPQVEAGRLLLRSGLCHALNDISDGLASEAREIAEASRCRIVLREADMPVDADLRRYADSCGGSALDWILYGGEDYQLVGTLPQAHVEALSGMFRTAAMPFHIIGTVMAGAQDGDGDVARSRGECAEAALHPVAIARADGTMEAVTRSGYNHFRTE